jgi:hypothetical protein
MSTFTHVNGGNGAGAHTASAASLSYVLAGVTAGDLLLVGVAAKLNGTTTFTVTDGSNTYVLDASKAENGNIYAGLFRSVVTTGGNLTIAVTPSLACEMTLGVDEYAFPAGTLIALDGPVAVGGASTGTAQTTGNLTPTTTGLVYGVSSGFTFLVGTLTAGSGFTPRFNYSVAGSGQEPILCMDIVANTTTPIAVTATNSLSSYWSIVGAAYKVVVLPIFAKPSNLPANHANPITITLVGSGTTWSGSPFSVTGDATLIGQTVTSTTAATLTVTTGSATGTATISDGTFTATLNVLTAKLALAPPGVGANTTSTVTATGTNTLWLSETESTLFSVAGLAGLSISNIAVTSNTAATFTLTSGTASGTATDTDTSTTATAAQIVYPLPPGIVVTPDFIPVSLTGIVLELTGTATTWSGTPFSLSGVTGVTLVSQIVTSTTTATIAVTTGTTSGTLTLSDGSYSTTIAVLPGSMVSLAYAGRGGLCYFVTTAATDTYAPPAAPTFSVTGTSITSGGLFYSNATALFIGVGGSGCVLGKPVLSGGSVVAVPVIVPGSGYTSARIVISDPTGQAAIVVPVLGGAPTAITAVNSNPTISVNGNVVAIAGPTWTNTTHTWPIAIYQLLCGQVSGVLVQNGGSGFTSPIATSTEGVVLGTPTLVNGVISSITCSGTATEGNQLTILDSAGTGSGFVGYYAVSGGNVISPVVIESGGQNYSSGANLTVRLSSQNGTASVTYGTPVLVNGAIGSVPVRSSPVNLTAAPTIAISDGGPGTGAVAVPLMSGPLPTDVITYSALPGWLTTVAGAVGAVSALAPIANYTVGLEPMFAQMPRTMPLGVNCQSPYSYAAGYAIPQNWLKNIQSPWTGAASPISAPTLLLGTVSATNGSGSIAFSVAQATSLDAQYCYIVGDTSGTLYTLSAVSGTGGTIAPAFGGTNLSGAPIVTMAKTTIAIYTAEGDTTGMLGRALATVNSAGQIAAVTPICGGSAYTVAPIVVMPAPTAGGTLSTGWVATIAGGAVTAITGGTPGAGYGGSTLDGQPIAINGTTVATGGTSSGIPTAHVVFAADNQSNSITTRNTWPDPAGIWTYTVDELNPSSPLVVTLWITQGTPISYTGTIVPGTLIDGVEIGRTWLFDVVRPAGLLELGLVLQVQGPTAGASVPYTHQNEFLTAPARVSGLAQPPNRAVPTAPDANFASWMSAIPSNPTLSSSAACLRFFCFANDAWDNGIVDVTDIRPAADYCWGDGPQRLQTAIVTAIRPYQIWSGSPGYFSPYVYTDEPYPGTVTALSLSIVDPPSPYVWIPPSNTTSNNVDWMMGNLASPDRFAMEYECAQPHGLKTGRIFFCPVNSLTTNLSLDDVNGSRTVNGGNISNSFQRVFVTGANTFAVCQYGGADMSAGPHMGNVNGVQSLTFPLTFPPIWGAFSPAFEATTGAVNGIPGCGLWILLPMFATSACITAICERIRDTLAVGRKFYVQTANEYWNSIGGVLGTWQEMWTMSGLMGGSAGITAGNTSQVYAWISGRNHTLATAAFNAMDVNGITGRGNMIVRVFGGQAGNSQEVNAQVAFLNAYNVANPLAPYQMDAIAVAPYLNVPTDSTIATAAAATYSNYPQSLQYQTAAPWTMGMWCDLWRHHAYYQAGAPNISLNNTALASYVLVNNQAPPTTICYEASVQIMTPTGLTVPTTGDWFLRTYITNDIYFHPYFSDVNDAFHYSLQAAGATLEASFNLCSPRGSGTLSPATLYNGVSDGLGALYGWPHTTWAGMPAGRGDGTPDQDGLPTVNLTFNATGIAQDLVNASPKLWSWKTWGATSDVVPPVVQAILDYADPRQGTILSPDNDPAAVDPRQGTILE